ncbi:hypothetical protein NDI44_23455 [Trichocoleus sp. DQ-A3]|nr:hypothetical protein [Coleofasciculus sp. FACHB-125]
MTGIVSRFISVPPICALSCKAFPQRPMPAVDLMMLLVRSPEAIDQSNLSFLLNKNPDAYKQPESHFIALTSF